MNERIKELAEQASEKINYRVDPNTFSEIDDPNGPYIRTQFNKEKFAELIIRECALTLESITVPVSDSFEDFDNGYNRGLLFGSAVIKKYFGVEE